MPRRLRALVTCLVLATCLGLNAYVAGGGSARAGSPYDVEVIQTDAALTQRMARLPHLHFTAAPPIGEEVIRVDDGRRYQRITGFGAAMTDTSAWLIERRLPATQRAALMQDVFGAAGLHLGVVRIPIGASDFTRGGRPYSYDDLPPGGADPQLRRFSIAHDRAYILPALAQARALNSRTEFLASPWSAPAWMKSNNSLANAHGLGTLRPGAGPVWAAYLARFIAAYRRAGVPIAALTPQNEPTTGTLYPGLAFPAGAEASWIAHDLVPALARAGEHPRIYAGDLGWGPHSEAYIASVLDGARSALSGVAWHCYFGAPGVMDALHQAHPRLDEILDECSPGGPTPTPTAEIVIASLREWASSVALWNLALDEHGGPVQPPNHGCPACIGLATVDTRSGTFSFSRSYFQLGQTSAFVAPGAQRIASNTFVAYRYPHVRGSVATPGLDDVALRNPDGSLVLVAYNGAGSPVSFSVAWRGLSLRDTLAPGTIATFVWNRS